MFRFVFILFLTFVTLHASANECSTNNNLTNHQLEEDGVGGTGHQNGGDGIGGTGHDTNNGDGIGGTGYLNNGSDGIGGTGIVGIVTGFASVCINGVEVHYNQETTVDVDGEAASTNALKVGQLVAINTANNNGRLEAKHISVSHPLIGKIEKVDATNNAIQVMGQTIKISPNTLGKNNLKPNQIVAVSGLVSKQGVIHTTRIDIAQKNTPSSITGLVSASGQINGVNISKGNSIKPNKQLQVKGTWNGHTLRPNQIVENPIQRVVNDANTVIIQGIDAVLGKNNVSVHHRQINMSDDTKTKGRTSVETQVIIVRGTKNEKGEINAKAIEYLKPEDILKHGGGRPTPQNIEVERPHAQKEHDNHKPNSVDKIESSHHIERPEQTEKTERVEVEKVEFEKPEKVEFEKPEKVEFEKPEKVEFEKPEKVEFEKPEKVEFEKPEKVEFEKPEKVEFEKPEKVEFEKPEKIEFEKPED